MQQRRNRVLLVTLIALAGLNAFLLVQGRVVPGVIGLAVFVVLFVSAVWAARKQIPSDSTPFPKPANAPPDGHVRFTLVVENLAPDRIADVWSDLCRPDHEPSEEFRLLFRNFTVVEGQRFRFRNGDPASTAALLTSVLRNATGIPVKTSLEPAAERTPPWS